MTYERSVAENLKACGCPSDEANYSADIADFFQCWDGGMYEATYHAGELSDVDHAAAVAAGLTDADVLAHVRSWADQYALAILAGRGEMAQKIQAIVALHAPAMTDDDLRREIAGLLA